MEINKKVGRSGGVTLPAALRREFGIQPGEKMNIKVDGSGRIVMTRTVGSCVFCASDENLAIYRGRFVCGSCRAALTEPEGGDQ
jgi:transcriptional pleiotropic regulator of transition state genes